MILYYPSFSSPSYARLPSIYPTMKTPPYLYSKLPILYPNLPFLLIQNYLSFPLSNTTIPSLYIELLILSSILHYPSFPLSYATLTTLYPTLFYVFSILQYPSFSSPLECRGEEIGVIYNYFRSNSISFQFKER